MADLTTAAVFVQTVQGNRRVISVEVSSAGATTSDTVSIPHLTAITVYGPAAFATTVFDVNAIGPILSSGNAANSVRIARSSLAIFPIRFTVEGR